jgi:DNA-binding response OmpR family regulator
MPKRILIAEDDFETNRLLTLIATRKGYQVVSAKDGIELMTFAAGERFDLIITDIKMPFHNGVYAVETMRLQGDTTPVVALTAFKSHEVELARDHFRKIFHKPCDVKELFEYIGVLLG